MAFDQATRNRLQKFVGDARKLLSEEFTQQLQNTYGLDPVTGGIAELSALPALSPSEQQTATLLRDTLEHYLAANHKADPHKDKALVIAALDRIVREQAFTVLNRLAALRMAEARQFLMESISQGYQSKGFQLYKRIAGSSLGEFGQAYQHYLFSVFDELSLDLAVLFDRYSSQGRLFPRETVLLDLLELINHAELEMLWGEDETVGWIYQFWNGRDEIDEMRAASRAPRNSREMAVRNQFFTPRYVVEFLTDNTLGRTWYEMNQGNTVLVDNCQYLVRRPNEIFLKFGEQVPEQVEQDKSELSQEELLQQTVYIQHRPIKDPRDIKMLDPACGSMHFGLYAFDLFEQIYAEAWDIEAEKGREIFFIEEGAVPKDALHYAYQSKEDFIADVPRLIIEHNIHGVDIDPRAAQIAGLSLWLRAQKSWSDNAIKPNQRPQIQRSNIVCAEPMPGETQLLKEFASQVQPRVLGQLVEEIFEKMQLAGEAGSLLKIEEEIQTAIEDAKLQKDENVLEVQGGLFGGKKWEVREGKRYYNFGDVGEDFWDKAEYLILAELERYAETATGDESGQKRLFASDAAKGFAFIDLCRKRFDVLLMNPPFGDASIKSKRYIDIAYTRTKGDVLANFIERSELITTDSGFVGAITSRTCLFLSSMSSLRETVLGKDTEIQLCADLGDGVLDAMVETAAYTLRKGVETSLFYRLVDEKNKENKLRQVVKDPSGLACVFVANPTNFRLLKDSPYCYWVRRPILDKISRPPIEPDMCEVKVGLQTGDDFRFLRNFWEVPVESDEWVFYSKTEEAIAWHSPIKMKVRWVDSGYELKGFTDKHGKQRSALRSPHLYFKPGFSYMNRSSRLVPYVVPRGCIPSAGRSQVFPHEGKEVDVLTICASNVGSAIARLRGNNFARPKYQAGMIQQLPSVDMPKAVRSSIESFMLKTIKDAKSFYASDETTLDYSGSASIKVSRKNVSNFYSLLGLENEVNVAEAYGLKKQEYEELILDLQQAVSLRKVHEEATDDEMIRIASLQFISYLVGCFFGRWAIKLESHVAVESSDVYQELPKQSNAFKWGESESDVERSGIADLESSSHGLLSVFQNSVYGGEKYVTQALVSGGIKNWEDYFSKPSGFFSYHYGQYSQNRRYSPIYWPLQTPSGSYSLWIYYHRLNEQTLFACVNDFVDPKLLNIQVDINSLQNKSTRSSGDEKELERLIDLEDELIQFRDELLRIAEFWKPNLNDGVQITAAPLWALFQYKPWQKKLKKTWSDLEKGECDWTHMAYNIWPERVLKKCHEDRSIAIAHGVEADLWAEVKVGGTRGREDNSVWKPKEMTAPELDTYVNNNIAQG